jgi:hypothetical protein
VRQKYFVLKKEYFCAKKNTCAQKKYFVLKKKYLRVEEGKEVKDDFWGGKVNKIKNVKNTSFSFVICFGCA